MNKLLLAILTVLAVTLGLFFGRETSAQVQKYRASKTNTAQRAKEFVRKTQKKTFKRAVAWWLNRRSKESE